jgi:hypothetical protein
MELYIRIKNGQPFEHPIFGDNFRQAFPEIDVNNLPPEFARFERVPQPSLVYATLNSNEPTYQWVDGIVKDVWDVTYMSEQEIVDKQNAVKADWATNLFQSWVFNEALCMFEPPEQRPNDGKQYIWDEPTISWVEVPETQE